MTWIPRHNTYYRGSRRENEIATNNDKIQFRGETEKEASQVVDQMRLGGINISELARQGLQEKLRETLSDEEKIELHRRYKQGGSLRRLHKSSLGTR